MAADGSPWQRVLRVLLLPALLAAAGAGLWHRWNGDHPASAVLVVALTHAAASAPTAPSGTTPPPAAPASAPAARLGRGQPDATDGCPAAWRRAGVPVSAAIQRWSDTQTPGALRRVARLLQASGDTGLALLGQVMNRPRLAAPPEPELALQLAAEAAMGSDPRVAGLAWQLCHGGEVLRPAGAPAAPSAPACSSVTAARWAELDPRNRQAWLAVAREAHARSDPAALEAALQRAAQAPESHLPWTQAMGALQAWGPTRLSAEDRVLAFFPLNLAETDNAMDAMGAVLALCPAEAATQARGAVCRRLAEAMVATGPGLSDRNGGTGLGNRMGWAPERVDAVRDETLRLSEALAHLTTLPSAEAGADPCVAWPAWVAAADTLRLDQEVAMARRVLAAARAASVTPP